MTDERFFFCHMQKTAGTALLGRILEDFSPAQIYPDQSPEGPDGDPIARVIVPELMLAQWSRRQELRVLTGHFPLCVSELIDVEFRTFTLLREPVARTLSLLGHHPVHNPADGARSIEEVYDDPFRFRSQIRNHMTKMLSLSVDEMTDGMLTDIDLTKVHLDRAKRNLEAIDVVGVQEDFTDFCRRLRETFGWRLSGRRFADGDVPNNPTSTDQREVPQAFVERILADNALDVELYAFACGLLGDS